ncbi:MAG: hypothetical protein WBO55_07905 [Rhizobiaceae bacterium]
MSTQTSSLKRASAFSIAALAILVCAIVAGLGEPIAGQEQFETLSDPAAYSALLAATGPRLRWVLYIDTLFALSYTAAVGFAALAYYGRNRAVALVSGVSIIIVMLLDFVENATMAHSLDLVGLQGQVTLEMIQHQATISAAKWHLAAATLFTVSFLLPDETLPEKLLVWGARLGLPFAVPAFLFDPSGLREMGGLLLLISMSGGLLLLAITAGARARSG